MEARVKANFDVPNNVYTVDTLEEAIGEAEKTGKPVSYLYGDPASNCGLHNHDAEVSLKEAKRFSIVVFLSTQRKNEIYNQVSPLVVTALKSDEMGNIIPKLVTASSDGTQIFALMSNKQMDQPRAFSDYRKQVSAGESWRMGGTESNPSLKWYLNNKKGRHYKATFIALDEENLKLKSLDNGRVFEMDLDEFTPGVVSYVKALNEQLKATEVIVYPVEVWTSTDGRELEGRFVRLNGNDITLHLMSGKEVTFKTELLSRSSLKRARDRSAKIASD